jgi:hypothetical protein
MSKDKRPTLLDLPETWENEWQGMPEFIQEDLSAFKTILVHFKNQEDVNAFSKLVSQQIKSRTKWIWYPRVKQKDLIKYQYVDTKEQEE